MSIPPSPLITRPGDHSSKTVRRAGAPNHLQGSGENPMVDTHATADTVTDVRARLGGQAHRFLTVDHAERCLRVDMAALAVLIADVLTEHTATLRAEHDEVVRETQLREQEVIALTVERDRALDRVSELQTQLSDLDGRGVA